MGRKESSTYKKRGEVIQPCSSKTKKLNIYTRQVQRLRAFSKDKPDKNLSK